MQYNLKQGGVIDIIPHNPRVLRVESLVKPEEFYNKDNRIQSISYRDEFVFSRGDSIALTLISKDGDKTDTLYKVNHINFNSGKYFLIEEKVNKSYYYVLPMLFDFKSKLKHGISDKENGYLTNSYVNISKEDKEKYELKDDRYYCILKYRYFNTSIFRTIDSLLRQHPNFYKCIEHDCYNTCYIFSLPWEFREDFDKLLKGDYSKISDTLKKKVISFNALSPTDHVTRVINRDKKLKLKLESELGVIIADDSELEEKLNLTLETL